MSSVNIKRSELLRQKGQIKLPLLHIQLQNDKTSQLNEELAEIIIKIEGDSQNEKS